MENKEFRETEKTIDENQIENGRSIVLMPLVNRLIGSIIDKIIIITLWYFLCYLLGFFDFVLTVILFVASNFFYYLFTETVYHASIGKRFLGGLLINKYGYEIGPGKAFLRAILLTAMIILSIYLKWKFFLLDTWLVIVVFFLVLDLPVLFCGKSLLDLCTRTMYEKPQK